MAKTKRFIVETLKVAQVPAHALTSEAIEALRQQASFLDTDKTLNEFMVSVDAINEMTREKSTHREELLALLKETRKYQCIHITKA